MRRDNHNNVNTAKVHREVPEQVQIDRAVVAVADDAGRPEPPRPGEVLPLNGGHHGSMGRDHA